jgi:ABC-type sugar transport system ATPase subunit
LLARKPRELSGGERQRVALARAIVRHPRAFLMDEPLSNLDAKLRLQMRGELKRLQSDLGTTTVYVTHDQAEAMTLGHRVAVMNQGKLQQFDTPLVIYNQPANRFVAEFVGIPGMNFVEGQQKGQSLAALGVDWPLTASQNAALDSATRTLTVGIRPEHVNISAAPADGWLQASVYVTELMGSETFVFLEVGGYRIVARGAADFRAEPETAVWVKLDMSRAHFFDAESGNRL